MKNKLKHSIHAESIFIIAALYFMVNLILIFVCLVAGVLLQRVKALPNNTHLKLNDFIINICLPALAILHIPKLEFNTSLWMPVATAWIVFPLAFVFFKVVQKWVGYDNRTLGCLTLCCGLFNSAFIGLPVVKSLYGAEGLKLAILVDQPGSFLVLSTLGIIAAAWFSEGKPQAGAMFKKIFSFPPIWGFAAAVVITFMGIELPHWVNMVLKAFTVLLTPLALISVGLQLKSDGDALAAKEVWVGLGFKLILAPLAIFGLYTAVATQYGLELKVSVIQAATAPMISGAILATNFGLNPVLASRLVSVGIPLSFLTLTIWYQLLERW